MVEQKEKKKEKKNEPIFSWCHPREPRSWTDPSASTAEFSFPQLWPKDDGPKQSERNIL